MWLVNVNSGVQKCDKSELIIHLVNVPVTVHLTAKSVGHIFFLKRFLRVFYIYSSSNISSMIWNI